MVMVKRVIYKQKYNENYLIDSKLRFVFISSIIKTIGLKYYFILLSFYV